jgi:hypothetical protein
VTLTEATPYIAIAAVALAVVALALLLVVNRRLKTLVRAQKVVLGSKGEVDIVRYVGGMEEKLGNLRVMVEDLAVAGKDYEVRIDNCLSHVGAVRFDAFHDLGGRQSTSVAFLNATEDGVVVTSAVSREFARVYVKLIRDGKPDIPLAPEEMEAVDMARARGNAPFTVRPRPDRIDEEAERVAEEAEETSGYADSPAALRALERENRRRERQGLPPVDELPPPPSSLGWPKLDDEEEAEDIDEPFRADVEASEIGLDRQ